MDGVIYKTYMEIGIEREGNPFEMYASCFDGVDTERYYKEYLNVVSLDI